ncbi:polysaccharide biosynthesis tyrosine autokinase [Herbiconiux sp. CPCC 203407]|uniref:non-specific protein-tyrosine kinase n=1 Tax=Herbiconiux oxytropis TaxID=2970915 RepID=A0AA42BWD0_9MICO|nr:polysaccharide biosynthesis tyrosine autokinase [Herbiconiux oxytropis]MCS5723239.1 polysaccharide biosynthesis tyrosine autokinase [Herbiconiux oxytropis]MCS5727894.1 polysaccharide biosynthesis tyrosine autokinase [Herbiconiux oxytropis]
MELRDYIRVLQKGWIFIVTLTLLGVALGAAYSLLKTPEYQASSKVFVSVQSSGSVSDLTQGGSFVQNQVKSYADIVTTPVVLQPVIASLGLTGDVNKLARQVTASSPVDTVIVEISASDTDPRRAAEIANAVASSFQSTVAELVPPNAEGIEPVKVTVLQQAVIPGSAYTPNVPLNIAFGGLIGLALGIAAAVLRETLDNRIHNERDVEAITDAPIIGGIAYDARTPQNPLIVKDDPRSPRAESFRTLRTNLQFVNVGESRSFVVTSSIPGEGKSTSAANLAIVVALSGQRVLLVDADLRKPKVASYLGLEGAAGLTDVLVGRAQPNDVIQRWGETNLYVLPAGRIPPNPSELLGSKAMVALIASFENSFDTVLFDAPPLLPVTDAAILTNNTSGALLMVAAGRAHKAHVRGAITTLANVGAKVAGIVITMLPTKGPDSYGYGRYGYAYGYGYGEFEADEAPVPAKSKRSK